MNLLLRWPLLQCPLFLGLLFLLTSVATAGELCIYTDSQGRFNQVNGLSSVPESYRAAARCIEELPGRGDRGSKATARLPLFEALRPKRSAPALSDQHYMAHPGEVQLGADVRRETLSSAVGPINLRWARSAEELFGRTPSRAMSDAAQTVGRALRGYGWPVEISQINLDWNVVFMDSKVPEAQIPGFLVGNCHPAWMTPEANLYIVSERVVAGCGGSRGAASGVGDNELALVLLHEMGHAIEFKLLTELSGGRPVLDEKVRSEGFASWFESYSAKHSSILNEGEILSRHRERAKQTINQGAGGFVFRGSAFDYSRASFYFHAIVKDRGVSGLIGIYRALGAERNDFFETVESALGWNRIQLEAKAQKIILVGS